jgi:porin
LTIAVAAVASLPAWADNPPPENPATGANAGAPQQTATPQEPEKHLLGDIAGLRTAIATYGLDFEVSETSEVLGNVTGGLKRGVIYEGLTDASLKWDLRPYFHWRGVFYVRAFQIHGRGLSVNYLDNLNTVSSIEANRDTRLFELWYEQHVGDWLRVRVGQQAADQEFIVSPTAKLFVNATFGFPTLPGADLPSRGPTYPLATPAIRLRFDPSEELTLFAGFFDSNPTGASFSNPDPQRLDPSGTAFRTSDGVLALLEARYNPGNDKRNGTYRLGAWFNSQRFSDQHFDVNGLSLANPLSTGSPRLLGNDYSIYAVVDQPLPMGKDGDKGLAGFARAMGAPGDRNLVSFYFDVGIAYKGPFGRDDDTAGIGLGYARISPAARGFDADTVSSTGSAYPIRSHEAVLEVSYQAQVTPWWQLQPDFQYIVNPGGGIPNPTAPARKIGDAAVLGLRTTVSF